MNAFTKALTAAVLLLVFAASPSRADLSQVSPRGQWLAEQLDAMDVVDKWIAGQHVAWETGLADGVPETLPGRHTHCSAFVAAFAKKVGVYILRPPRHGQVLLANAQNEWLQAGSDGWRPVASAIEAQDLANQGYLVVASYHNHHDDKPGHISIIRPAVRMSAEIEADGPLSIQAGTVNSARISVREGFAGHVHAWKDGEIEYFAHEIDAQR